MINNFKNMLNISDNIDVVHSYIPKITNLEESNQNANQSAEDASVEQVAPYYQDKLSISDEYYDKLNREKENDTTQNSNEKSNTIGDQAEKSAKTEEKKKSSEEKVIKEMEKRDQDVRTHEQAHKAAGGGLVKGGASYNYTIGPDGKQYAIGGEVKIDMAPVDGDPQATIAKMQQVKKAALAPSDPSSQDLSVASVAGHIETQARQELTKQDSTKSNTSGNSSNSDKDKQSNTEKLSDHQTSASIVVNNSLKSNSMSIKQKN